MHKICDDNYIISLLFNMLWGLDVEQKSIRERLKLGTIDIKQLRMTLNWIKNITLALFC